jgi:DNA-binding NtrC family response regulator
MSEQPGASPAGGRILVVDDDEFVCSSLKWLLMDEGYDVEVAVDGKTAIEMLDRRAYDLVLTDLMMPEVDGLAVLHEVKKRNPCTAVIILTGYGTLEAAMSALKDGAYDFLTKPCDDGEMKFKIQGALEHKRLSERVRELESVAADAAGTEFVERLATWADRELERAERLSDEELRPRLGELRRKLREIRDAAAGQRLPGTPPRADIGRRLKDLLA